MAGERAPSRRDWRETFSVYFKRRVLIVFLLGFSGGLPIVLVGSTLQAWMKQNGVDIRTIGLITAVALPYNLKFLWAPLVDAFDIPVLSRLLGRRRGWLLFSQILLMATIVCLGLCDPAVSIPLITVGADDILVPPSFSREIHAAIQTPTGWRGFGI